MVGSRFRVLVGHVEIMDGLDGVYETGRSQPKVLVVAVSYLTRNCSFLQQILPLTMDATWNSV
jgi:hypothetical protein